MEEININDLLVSMPNVQSKPLKNGKQSFFIQATFWLRNNEKSKRVKIQIKGAQTKTEANKLKESAIKEFIQSERYQKIKSNKLSEKNPFLNEFIDEIWIPGFFENKYTNPRTRQEMMYKLNHIKKLIGHYPINSIDFNIIQDMYNKIVNYDINLNKRIHQLSNPSLYKYNSLLKKIFDYAKLKKIVKHNEIRLFLESGVQIVKKEQTLQIHKDSFTEEELKIMFKEAKKWDNQFYLIIKLAAMTGLRRGEILALDIYKSISYTSDGHLVLKIDRAISTAVQREIIIKLPKNNEIRSVYIADKEFISQLEEHIKQRKKFMEEHPPVFTDYVPLFSSFVRYNGRPLSSTTLTQKFKIFHEKKIKIKYPDFVYRNFHCLRHTTATLLLKYSNDLLAAQKQLGHKSIKTTEKFYIHSDDTKLIDNANLFTNILN